MKILAFCLSLLCIIYSSNILAIPPIPDIPPFPQIISGPTTYYLNNVTGDNDDNGGSEGSAWATFKYAANQLLPGDTLIINGTGIPYDLQWTELVSTDTNTEWITIEGRDGINGERATLTGRLYFGVKDESSASYIYLNNLDFQGPGGSNVNIIINSNSHHLAFENIEIDCQGQSDDYNNEDANERAIVTNNNVDHLWFKDMHVHHCGYKRNVPYTEPRETYPTDCGGICIKGSNINEVVFENVSATQNVGDGIGGGSAISYGNSYFKQCLSEGNTGDGYDLGGTRVVFINNIAKDNGGHQGAGFKLWSKETWLVNSVAYNNKYLGISVKPQHSGDNHAYILNSTLAKNNIGIYGGQISTTRRHPPSGDLYFYLHNNIFHSLNTAGILLNNTTIQHIQEESHNYYFSEYDSTLPLLSWTYEHAIHLRDGTWQDDGDGVWEAGEPWNIVGEYTFADVANDGRWSDDSELWSPGILLGVGNIGETDLEGKTDPGFKSLDSPDLHLSEGSLAIDAGTDVGITSDIDGSPVPIGAAPDMGAYELTDHDFDGYPTLSDNCPYIANDQSDLDGDGIGNACDADVDGDSFSSPGDCDDYDSDSYPGALEISFDGIDQDCQGGDATIDVLKSTYANKKNGTLEVEAVSNAGQSDVLLVESYNAMKWSKGQGHWALKQTDVSSNPMVVRITGQEGTVEAEVNVIAK